MHYKGRNNDIKEAIVCIVTLVVVFWLLLNLK
jgi:hypothetical protein